MEFKVGQKVYSLAYGWGEVTKVDALDGDLPICATFNEDVFWFTKDGRLESKKNPISLFHYEPEIIEPKWKPKEGEWCWFWDDSSDGVALLRFKTMDGNEFVSDNDAVWENCAPFVGELPEHLKNI